LRTKTVGEPGAQGAGITGTQGMGVNTPAAADVAAYTVGFDSDWHIPNGGMLEIGILSMILAAGGPCPSTVGTGTSSALGDIPKLHAIMAPIETC
jgi:hypothetical protein